MLAERERPERRCVTAGQRRAPRAPAGTVAVEREGQDHGPEGFVDGEFQGPRKFEAGAATRVGWWAIMTETGETWKWGFKRLWLLQIVSFPSFCVEFLPFRAHLK